VGLVGSSKIAGKFGHAPAIGFMCGKRNGITVLDVDTTDERVLADAVNRHGQTPVVVRTGSGHPQVWYRHNSERRRIRPDRNVPIDILGAGFVVAPPSQSAKGSYEFISGGLDDLDRLPVMQKCRWKRGTIPGWSPRSSRGSATTGCSVRVSRPPGTVTTSTRSVM